MASPTVPSGTTVYVKGFSSRATPEDLAELFRDCGKVKKVSKSGSGEYAYVEYESHAGARAAVREMNGIQFDGGSLTVELKDEAPNEAPARSSATRESPFHRPDTRTCHNCGKQGHIARNCPEPPRDPRYLDTRGTRRPESHVSAYRERDEPYRPRDVETRRYEERYGASRSPPRYAGGAAPAIDSADYKLFQEFLEFKKRMAGDGGRDPYGAAYPSSSGYERPRDYAPAYERPGEYSRAAPPVDYRYAAAPPEETTFTVRVPSSYAAEDDYRRGSFGGRSRDYGTDRGGYATRSRETYARGADRYPPRNDRDFPPREPRR